MRYAVALQDLDAAWGTREGASLVEAAVLDQDTEDAEVVSIAGTQAIVLRGPAPRVAAVVAGLVAARLPGDCDRAVRVYTETPRGWAPVLTPPPVPVLPDDSPSLDLEEAAA